MATGSAASLRTWASLIAIIGVLAVMILGFVGFSAMADYATTASGWVYVAIALGVALQVGWLYRVTVALAEILEQQTSIARGMDEEALRK